MRDDEMWRPIAVGSSSMRQDGQVTSYAGNGDDGCSEDLAEESSQDLEDYEDPGYRPKATDCFSRSDVVKQVGNASIRPSLSPSCYTDSYSTRFHSTSIFQRSRRLCSKGWLMFAYLLVFTLLLLNFQPALSALQSHKPTNISPTKTCDHICFSGSCVNGKCNCPMGFAGTRCEYCYGRQKLNGTEGNITSSFGKYPPGANCMWLIDGHHDGALYLQFPEFETENYWDHLYIYDGSGAHDNLMAAFSGKHKGKELIVPSGKAILYFTSDIAINHPGFTIKYSYDTCIHNCSGHGSCDKGICKCDDGYAGQACEESYCHEKIAKNPCLNEGKCVNGVCSCASDRHGRLCQALKTEATWDRLLEKKPNEDVFHPRASHTAVNVNGMIYIYGGHTLSKYGADLIQFDPKTEEFKAVEPKPGERPKHRYGHSMVLFDNKLYVFGGVIPEEKHRITNELWQYNIGTNKWDMLGEYVHRANATPAAVIGHTAHVYENKMYIVFGYNPFLGYVPYVQILDFGTWEWSKPWVEGGMDPTVVGRFGHSSVLTTSSDNKNAQILVFGGYLHVPNGASAVTDEFLSYSIKSDFWTTLAPFDSPRFLHTAVLVDGMMILFGGNSPNESQPHESGYPSSNLLIYDTMCKKWDKISVREVDGLYRYGHSAVTIDLEGETKIYVFGGFDGLMKNDVVVLILAKDCNAETFLSSECYNIAKGVRCSMIGKTCQRVRSDVSYAQPFAHFIKNNSPRIQAITCPDADPTLQMDEELCSFIKDCMKCVSRPTCGWCSSTEQCQSATSVCLDEMQTDQRMCSNPRMVKTFSPAEKRPCSMSPNCHSCHVYNCAWVEDKLCVSHAEQALMIAEHLKSQAELSNRYTNGRSEAVSLVKSIKKGGLPYFRYSSLHERLFVNTCPPPCSDYSDCKKCVENSCMWCPTVQRCIAMETYMVNCPYGQCPTWVTANNNHHHSCDLNPLDCSAQKNASDCQLVGPHCGWCDSGDGTGIGECLAAANDVRPINESLCNPAEGKKFYYTGQPECQCNGHSECIKASHKPVFMDVMQPNPIPISMKICSNCSNHTRGDHCEFCEDGYYGDPRNGGECKKCNCYYQAETCNEDGSCNCIVKGAKDEACNTCDYKYNGHPKEGIPCAFDLLIDFIYTFKLDADDPKDKYVQRIHFNSTPFKRDIDVQFTVSCEGDSDATVLVDLYNNHTKRSLYNNSCFPEGLKRTYSANDFHFGAGSNTSFGVTISNFRTPIKIQISFAQSPPINWVLFFVIFAACFIVLLVVAGILLLIKQRIRNAGQEANILIENERMAARPKKSVQLHLPDVKRNAQPTPIAIEPCKNLNTAIYTVVVRLPTGGGIHTPYGTSGLAVASALCHLSQSQLAVLEPPNEGERSESPNKTDFRRFIPSFMRRRPR